MSADMACAAGWFLRALSLVGHLLVSGLTGAGLILPVSRA